MTAIRASEVRKLKALKNISWLTARQLNKVAGALVTFTAPASGASGSFDTRTHPRTVTIRTDSGGIALAPPFIADTQPGGYIVIATVAHGPRTAFALVLSNQIAGYIAQ